MNATKESSLSNINLCVEVCVKNHFKIHQDEGHLNHSCTGLFFCVNKDKYEIKYKVLDILQAEFYCWK
jgi:hypothetical protein